LRRYAALVESVADEGSADAKAEFAYETIRA
jgi:hypothetical protein